MTLKSLLSYPQSLLGPHRLVFWYLCGRVLSFWFGRGLKWSVDLGIALSVLLVSPFSFLSFVKDIGPSSHSHLLDKRPSQVTVANRIYRDFTLAAIHLIGPVTSKASWREKIFFQDFAITVWYKNTTGLIYGQTIQSRFWRASFKGCRQKTCVLAEYGHCLLFIFVILESAINLSVSCSGAACEVGILRMDKRNGMLNV